jgi:polyhydroxyalkanoate synthase
VLEAVRGSAEVPLVSWAAQLSSFQRLVTKPLALAGHLDDADYLAQIEAVDRFSAAMTAYRGRTFGQVYHRLLAGDSLVEGQATVGSRTVSVADVTQPLLVLAGATDQIAPVAAVKAGVSLATGSRDARFEIVPGGHLGMLTGREARTGTWRVLDSWYDEWADLPAATPRRTAKRAVAKKVPAAKAARRKAPVKKAVTKKTAAKKAPVKKAAVTKAAATKAPVKKTPARKTPVKKAAAKKAPAKKAAAEQTTEPVIGANASRRYGSAGSRALGRPTR